MGKLHCHHVDIHCSSLTLHGQKVCICVCICVHRCAPCTFALMTAAWPTMKRVLVQQMKWPHSRQTDRGATSVPLQRGSPKLDVFYWTNTEVSSFRESGHLSFSLRQKVLQKPQWLNIALDCKFACILFFVVFFFFCRTSESTTKVNFHYGDVCNII